MGTQAPEWMRKMRERQVAQLIEDGFLQESESEAESGGLLLTEKGMIRAAARLDKLSDGDEILLEVAFLSHYGVTLIP